MLRMRWHLVSCGPVDAVPGAAKVEHYQCLATCRHAARYCRASTRSAAIIQYTCSQWCEMICKGKKPPRSRDASRSCIIRP